MRKIDQKSSSRSTSSSDRSSITRGVRYDEMLNILTQNYSDLNALKKRKFSQESNSSRRNNSLPFKELQNSNEPAQRFQNFMEKKASTKIKFLDPPSNPQNGQVKTESPRRDLQKLSRRSKHKRRIQKSLSFLQRMMLEQSIKRKLSLQFNESFQEVISISQRDVKLDITNFCVFRSLLCSHPNSCLNNLVASTISTGLKSMTVTFLGTLVSKYLFKNLKICSEMPFQIGVLASLINFCSNLSSCLLKGIFNKTSSFFPIIGCFFSSWGLLLFPKETRKNIVILALTLCFDLLFRRFLYTSEKQNQYQNEQSYFQLIKRRIKSKRIWLQMLLFVICVSLSTCFSTKYGLLAGRKLDIFGRALKGAFGWK